MAWSGLVLSLILVLGALAALRLSRRYQRASGLPEGEVIYSDGAAWMTNNDVLYDRSLKLAGKPDYLVQQEDGRIIPVEVKSAPAPNLPYPGHVLQLMAYCRLVETTYGVRPSHGILQYKDRAFSVEYTLTLEQDLLDTLAEMRIDQAAQDVLPDHNDLRRCRACGFRNACDVALA